MSRADDPAHGSPAPLPAAPDGPDLRAAALAELGLMTAALLHEARQPLFALKAQAQLLAARGDDGARMMLEQIEHLEELVGFYGSFGRHRGPALPVDLNGEVRSVLQVMRRQARRRRIELVSALHAESLMIRGRAVAVRQIVVNLTHNAFDALDEHETGRIEVRTAPRDNGVCLCVQDDGPGIGEELAARLFEPWVSTKGEQGSGLGLYLTRELAAEAGGRVRLIPAEGPGACFEVWWPAG